MLASNVDKKRFGLIPVNAKLLSFAPYYVTKDGKTVFSMITGKPIKQNLEIRGNKRAYYRVWLRHKDGTKHWHKVSRLVASLFVMNYKPSTQGEVGWTDGNSLNNSHTNLYWASHGRLIISNRIRNFSKSILVNT